MKDGVEPAAFASSGTTAGTSQFKDFPSPSKGMLDTLEDTESTNLLSLKLTFSPLKMDGWKTRFPLGFGPFSGGENVRFRYRVTSFLSQFSGTSFAMLPLQVKGWMEQLGFNK